MKRVTVQFLIIEMILQRLVESRPLLRCVCRYKFERNLADLSGRSVDHPLESQIIVRRDKPQITDAILDLHPFEEPHSSPHHVRDVSADERLLDES